MQLLSGCGPDSNSQMDPGGQIMSQVLMEDKINVGYSEQCSKNNIIFRNIGIQRRCRNNNIIITMIGPTKFYIHDRREQ